MAHFEEQVGRYKPMLYRRAYLILGNWEDAKDAVQDALLNAYKHLDRFEGRSTLGTWLHTIVINSARMRRRRSAAPSSNHIVNFEDTASEIPFDPADAHQLDPEAELLNSELRQQLHIAILGLPRQMQTVIRLRLLEDCDTRKTSQLMGITESCVKSTFSRAKLKLRERLTAMQAVR